MDVLQAIVRLASFRPPAQGRAIGCLGSHPWTRLSHRGAFRVPPLGILWAGGQQCPHWGWKDMRGVYGKEKTPPVGGWSRPSTRGQ